MKKISCMLLITLATNVGINFNVQALENKDDKEKNIKVEQSITKKNKENDDKNKLSEEENYDLKNKNSNKTIDKDKNIQDNSLNSHENLKEEESNKDPIKDDVIKSKENKEVNENLSSKLYDKLEEAPKNITLNSYANLNLENIDIISKSLINKDVAKEWAKKRNATEEFILLADLYWKYAEQRGNINPAIAYAQAAKETEYGKFGGAIDNTYHNPCALKTSKGGADNDPNAHKKFNNWDEGVQAHLDHLALYAGAEGYPRKDTFDPRHFASIKGKAQTVIQLGGVWAPSEVYGAEVLKLYTSMLEEGKAKIGWIKKNEKKYYYDTNGNMTIGWKSIDGFKYYFNKDGSMNTTVLKENDSLYYFGEEGYLKYHFKTIHGKTICYNDKNEIQKGLIEIDRNWYYFKNGEVQTKWVQIDGNWHYFNNDGKMQIGWATLEDGHKYYFDNNGVMQVGWLNLNNSTYYLNDSGVMVTGWNNIENSKYYFDNNGVKQIGWLNLNNNKYYLDTEGKMVTGWIAFEGKWHYFNNDGCMLTGFNVLSDGETYHFNNDGIMNTGWIQLEDGKYYFNASGVMQTGWIQENGAWRYLSNDGKMQTWWTRLPDSNWYFFNNEGIMHTGWLKLDGGTYYLNKSGVMETGWTKIGENIHYFYESGVMAVNTTIDGYYIDENGIRREKKLIVVDPGHNYGGDDGSYATHDGIRYSETELNMEVAVKLREKLEKMGYTVIMTRSPFERPIDGLNESIRKRVDLANDLNADAFISIHHDSGASLATGVTTFYSSYKPGLDNTDIVTGVDPNGYDWYDFKMDLTPTKEAIKGKELAKIIVDNLSKSGSYSNRKEHDRGLGVTRRTNMPSVLVECGFISNREEAKKCANPKQQEKIAQSIAESIKKMI